MFNSLEEIINVLKNGEGHIKTNVTFSIDDLFEYSMEELTEIVSEKVFGDFADRLSFVEVEVCRIIGCDTRRQTVEIEVNVSACWEDEEEDNE